MSEEISPAHGSPYLHRFAGLYEILREHNLLAG